MRSSTKRWRRWTYGGIMAILGIGITGGLLYMVVRGGGSLPVTGQAPGMSGTDLAGKTVSISQLDGKVRLVTWFYTHCPDECPLTAYQMKTLQQQLEQRGQFGTKVAFVSMTLDPRRDTLPVIRKWAGHFDANPAGWYFLRAEPADTTAILQNWGVGKKASTNPEFIEHVVKTELIDQNGNIRKVYPTANLNTTEVMNDIQNLVSRGS